MSRSFDLGELLPPPDDRSFEVRRADEVMERLGHLAYLLSPNRLHLGGRTRQLLGYMLREPDWMPNPIDKVAVLPDGQVVAALAGNSGIVVCYGPVPDVLEGLRRVCARAELDSDDAEFLLSLPGVDDRRPDFGGASNNG